MRARDESEQCGGRQRESTRNIESGQGTGMRPTENTQLFERRNSAGSQPQKTGRQRRNSGPPNISLGNSYSIDYSQNKQI